MSDNGGEDTPQTVNIVGGGFHVIWRQVKRAPKEFLLGGFGALIFAVTTILAAYLIGFITDRVLLPASNDGEVTTALLAGAAGLFIAVSTVKAVGIVLRRVGAYYATYRLQYRDRIAVTDRYLELPIEWHRKHSTGQLMANTNEDVEAASFIAGPLPLAFGVVILLIVTGILLILTDPFLALIGFAVGPALLIVNYVFQRRMRAVAASAQQIRAEVADIAHESFDAALVVKTLGREDAEVYRFGERSEALRDRMVEVGRLRAAFDPIIEALPSIGILAILAVGALRVDQGVLTAGTLIAFAYLFRLVALPIRVFGWLLGELPRAMVGLRRVETVLAEGDRFEYGAHDPVEDGGAAASAEKAEYLYPETEHHDLLTGAADGSTSPNGDRRGIDSVSLNVPAGKTVALVGPTGSGKSTIAHLLVRLFDPERGEICLDGHTLVDVDRDALAEAVSIVFQETFLFNDSVYNNITLAEEFSEEKVIRAAGLAKAHGFIEDLDHGYATIVGERGATLSGGQRQRVALARALIREPRLLILDDATSAVDPAVEAEILDGLGSLETSVVIVAYRRSSIVMADEVIFIEDGRVIARGTHERLYASVAPYRELIDAYDRLEEPA